MFKVDWYQATFYEMKHEVIIKLLFNFYENKYPDVFVDETKDFIKGFPFKVALKFPTNDSQVLIAWDIDRLQAHVKATGERARGLDEFLRPHDPHVSRIDIAVDVSGMQMYDRIARPAKRWIDRNKIKYSEIVSSENRTFYVFSESSSHRFCIYEKGLMQINKFNNKEADPDWVRVELRVKPQSKDKYTIGQMTPEQIFSASGKVPEFIQAIGLFEITKTESYRSLRPQYGKHHSKLVWMARMFIPLLDDLAKPEQHGSDEAALAYLRDILQRQENHGFVITDDTFQPCPF